MSHDIEINEDGEASFFSARVPAWHRLGTVTEAEVSVAEALELANMNYEVRKQPIFVTGETPDGRRVKVKASDHVATVRDTKYGPEILGIVGKDYGVVQFSEAWALADYISDLSEDTDGGKALVSAAGVLDEGRRGFLTMKFPNDMVLDPQGAGDRITDWLVFTNSFDGTLAVLCLATFVRTVCQNTLTMALNEAQRVVRIKHTRNVLNNIELAKQALETHFAYRQAFQQAAEKLIQQSYTDAQFQKLIEGVFPMPKDPSPRQTSTVEDTWNGLKFLFVSAPTNENIRGTRWAAYNAITEYVDHYRDVRTKGYDSPAAARAAATMFSPWVEKKKDRALELLKV